LPVSGGSRYIPRLLVGIVIISRAEHANEILPGARAFDARVRIFAGLLRRIERLVHVASSVCAAPPSDFHLSTMRFAIL
jgi:hypothetical protein